MNIPRIFSIAALALIASCTTAQAATTPIPLHYGSNTINFGKGSGTGIAMLARRENFNAHGFDVLTMYIKPADGEAEDWQFVSLFDGKDEALTLGVSGGADCLLHDFRLIKDAPNGGLSLVVAEREFGSSYVDDAPVKFKFYHLKHNAESLVGWPAYYFELASTKQSKKNYCDVGTAFDKELGIGTYRK